MIAPSLLAGAAFAAPPAYDVAPVPSWVDVLSEPAADAVPDADGAEQYLLVDNQIQLDRVERAYSHYVTRIRTVAGVEDNSQVSVSFDPKREQLHLHTAVVRRGTQTFNELKTGRIQVLRQERDLRNGLLGGELTFTLIMADVRVDDLVEYSYTIERRDGEWSDLHFGRYAVQWSDPVVRQRLRILRPDGATLHVAGEGSAVPRTWSAGGWHYWEFAQANVPGVKDESHVPDWIEDRQGIQYSQFEDWRDVAQRALPLYRTTPADRAAAAAAAREVTAGLADPAQRTIAILKFVQSQVRYTGIEEGEGAFRPSAPALVLSRRYGDCKDKALLAVSMLQSVDVNAAPALVSTEWRHALSSRLPSPGNMNHVIVRAIIDGKTYWFDATATGQEGDLEHFTQANFGQALVVAAGVTGLEAIPVPDADRPHVIADQQVDLRAADGNARLTQTSQFLGSEADGLRRRLAAQGKAKVSDEYLDYYRSRYPKLSLQAPATFVDDPVNDVMTVTESYAIPQAFAAGKSLRVMADEVIEELRLPAAHRQQPYRLNYPMNVVQRVRLLMPRAWPVKTENVRVEAPEFRYDSSVSSVGDEVLLSYQYHARQDSVAVTRLEGYLKDSHRARDDLYYRVNHDGATQVTVQSSGHAWAPWLLGVLGVFLVMRLVLPYAVWLRVALGLALRAPGAEPCADADVPPDDQGVVTLLDGTLQALGFLPLGYLRVASATYENQPWEYVRTLTRAGLPIDAWVNRRAQPEFGRYVALTFVSRLADGRTLLTTQQTLDPTIDPRQVLASTHPALAPEALFERHQARLRSEPDAAWQAASLDLGDHARHYRRLAVSLRERQRASGTVTVDSLGRDRFTLLGAAGQARTIVRTLASQRSQARGVQEISREERQLRLQADRLAVAHVSREPADNPLYWPLSAFSMLLVASLLAGVALVVDPEAAATLLIAVLIHEAGHAVAMRAVGATRGPLLLLPLLAIVPRDVPGTSSSVRRALIVAAGPVTGLIAALVGLVLYARWPSPHILRGVADLTFVTAFSLLPTGGSDMTRLVDMLSSPASRWRYAPVLVVPAVLIGLSLMPSRVQSTFMSAAVAAVLLGLLHLRRLQAVRRLACRIPADADWSTAVHHALDGMGEPRCRRWLSASRVLTAVAIADQLIARRRAARPALKPAADSLEG